MQKIPNALDILIEDAKSNLQTWGSQPPTFCLCNSALTAQLTMLPELTNYVTNGPDGAKRLAQGPSLSSYRGLQIIPSRKFSMDAGTAPRDLLRRRVRVAEYYRIPWHADNVNRSYEFYDQSRDTMFCLTWKDLVKRSSLGGASGGGGGGGGAAAAAVEAAAAAAAAAPTAQAGAARAAAARTAAMAQAPGASRTFRASPPRCTRSGTGTPAPRASKTGSFCEDATV